MENNACDVNHLDADVLLPPRKRLLAGLKRQNSDVNPSTPSTSSNGGREFDTRMNNLLKSHLSNPNLSNEEIAEASRLAAIETAKAARVARAVAEEKAAKAAKAVAAAKSALELVASITEETANREKYLKKNKMKKHVAVQTLYNKHRGSYNCRTDEELARKLHRAINSSPRISKNTSTSDAKKHKKLKCSPSSEKAAEDHGATASGGTPDDHGVISLGGMRSSANNGNGMAGEEDKDISLEKTYMARVDLNIPKFNKSDVLKMAIGEASKFTKSDQLDMGNWGVETVVVDEKDGEEDDSGNNSKKRGRIKQKKLPLSICNSRDQVSPKQDTKRLPSSIEDGRRSNAISSNKSLFSVSSSADSVIPVERNPIWKCQSFKAPACVKQNKLMQS